MLSLTAWSFFALGSAGLLGAGSISWGTSQRLARAELDTGVVTDINHRQTPDGPSCHAEVAFTTRAGARRNFLDKSSDCSRNVGDSVPVVFDPAPAGEAYVDRPGSTWGAPLALGGIASIFFCIGSGILITAFVRARRATHLRRHGVPVDGTLQGIEVNDSLEVNGRHPLRIVVSWQDAQGKTRLFRGRNLWFNPAPLLSEKRTVRVFLDPKDQRRFHVDDSFLPTE